jgi:hypothetical protein
MHGEQTRWPRVGRGLRRSTGTCRATDHHLRTGEDFSLFTLRAILDGRGNEIIDLAKENLLW